MNYLAIAFGAVLGALLRHMLFIFIKIDSFPYHTLAVNVIGCFFIGVFAEYCIIKGSVPLSVRLFFITGFLGSFTTFSSFALDTGYLSDKGEFLKAFLYVGSSVFLGLAGYFTAVYIVRSLIR
ncbi:MAG: fluoride efflux transporter CrcB [Campylobacteraceae bacterium]|nr:fluoride efflux transporter CrcB [Campylobacteraceae bacterium]